jgi:hypothetical protein
MSFLTRLSSIPKLADVFRLPALGAFKFNSPFQGIFDQPPTATRMWDEAVRAVVVEMEPQLAEQDVQRIVDAALAEVRAARRAKHSQDAAEPHDDEQPQRHAAGAVGVDEPAEIQDPKKRRVVELLQMIGRGKYASTKIGTVVEKMVERAEGNALAKTFEAEKIFLRDLVKEAKHPTEICANRKNEGHLPLLSTFNKDINSLQPIYQKLRETLRN